MVKRFEMFLTTCLVSLAITLAIHSYNYISKREVNGFYAKMV